MKTKTIVITGASSGIGAATARAFARIGWQVVAGARRVDKLQELALEFKDTQFHSIPLDVCERQSVANFASEISKKFPDGIDVLVNNAGLAIGTDRLSDGNEEDSDQVMETNVMGLLRVTRALLPRMIEHQKGHIINMGSIAGFLVYEGGGVYCASKHAVRAITKTLRLELNGTPIRVTSIDPGMVETEFSNIRFNDPEKAKSVYKGMTPLTGEDIADCILWSVLRPAHVNIDEIVVMPVDQAAPHKVNRKV